jgi:proline-specific peptidase
MADFPVQEGRAPVTGGHVWYRIVGGGDATPLLVLHGGPGVPHDYLEALEVLADERPVVFYDQLGCGRSDRPDDPALWQIERFVAEVDEVRAALNLNRVHLLGHSWGSMLAADYALTQPPGLMSLILAGPILSNTRYLSELQRLRRLLPAELQRDLDAHERAGTYDDPAYQAALGVFYKRHLARLDPPPESSQRAGAGANGAIYQAMWGPSEFVISGTLQGYEREHRLYELTLPVLLTCGREDLTTPQAAEVYQRLLPAAELVVFEASAHGPHDEEPERYAQTLRAFLRRADTRAV